MNKFLLIICFFIAGLWAQTQIFSNKILPQAGIP